MCEGAGTDVKENSPNTVVSWEHCTTYCGIAGSALSSLCRAFVPPARRLQMLLQHDGSFTSPTNNPSQGQ